MMRRTRSELRHFGPAAGLALVLALGGCENAQEPEPAPTSSATPSEAPRSIFQPEYQAEDAPEEGPAVPEPLAETIGFPDGGSTLDEQAQVAIRTVLGSDQIGQGWPIIVRGHSDAGGSDAVNMRVSQARAEAVRDALIEGGVAENRITIIAFGEQNPVRPNALPDGEPNEAGRAANRRAEIAIDPPVEIPASTEREPTIVETIATPSSGPSPLTSPTPRAERQR